MVIGEGEGLLGNVDQVSRLCNECFWRNPGRQCRFGYLRGRGRGASFAGTFPGGVDSRLLQLPPPPPPAGGMLVATPTPKLELSIVALKLGT